MFAKSTDLIGKKFGKLTVVSKVPYDFPLDYKACLGIPDFQWRTICKCGTELDVLGSLLRHGCAVHCSSECRSYQRNREKKNTKLGKQKEPIPEVESKPYTRGKLPPREQAIRTLLTRYWNGARVRELDWNLSIEQFEKLITSPCHYSGHPPSKQVETKGGIFFWTGIDRKDSSKGYTIDNCVPCHEIANYAKRDKSYSEFTNWLDQLVEYRNSLKEPA